MGAWDGQKAFIEKHGNKLRSYLVMSDHFPEFELPGVWSFDFELSIETALMVEEIRMQLFKHELQKIKLN